jgi:CubicO group peptidase (beta-lactamase class C family)
LLDGSGELYSTEHFSERNPGEEHDYSNVGAALAAEMLSVASGKDYKTWTEENILNPLNMDHTHWFNREFVEIESPATRYVLRLYLSLPLLRGVTVDLKLLQQTYHDFYCR